MSCWVLRSCFSPSLTLYLAQIQEQDFAGAMPGMYPTADKREAYEFWSIRRARAYTKYVASVGFTGYKVVRRARSIRRQWIEE